MRGFTPPVLGSSFEAIVPPVIMSPIEGFPSVFIILVSFFSSLNLLISFASKIFSLGIPIFIFLPDFTPNLLKKATIFLLKIVQELS